MLELIPLLIIISTLLTIFFLHKTFDKRGLYFALIIFDIISFIFSFKISLILKMNVNMGIITLIEMYTILYIFIIKYGTKEVKDIIKITLYTNIMISLIIVIMNYFIPTITETVSINMQGTFEYNYKLLIIYPIITLISQFLIAKFYEFMCTITKYISICIILTYIITSMLYIITYCTIGYINIMDMKHSLFIGISTYIIGIFITLINIPYIKYITDKKVKK